MGAKPSLCLARARAGVRLQGCVHSWGGVHRGLGTEWGPLRWPHPSAIFEARPRVDGGWGGLRSGPRPPQPRGAVARTDPEPGGGPLEGTWATHWLDSVPRHSDSNLEMVARGARKASLDETCKEAAAFEGTLGGHVLGFGPCAFEPSSTAN